MGLFNRAISFSTEAVKSLREELYMRLFPKIGRDFVHVDDLADILIKVVNGEVSSADEVIMLVYNHAGAQARAEQYKLLLDSDIMGSDYHPDLVELDD